MVTSNHLVAATRDVGLVAVDSGPNGQRSWLHGGQHVPIRCEAPAFAPSLLDPLSPGMCNGRPVPMTHDLTPLPMTSPHYLAADLVLMLLEKGIYPQALGCSSHALTIVHPHLFGSGFAGSGLAVELTRLRRRNTHDV